MIDDVLYIRVVKYEDNAWLYIQGSFAGYNANTYIIIDKINNWMRGFWNIRSIDYEEHYLTDDAYVKYMYAQPPRYFGNFEIGELL